jgi:ABC-2 type transport system ATP-binding protein
MIHVKGLTKSYGAIRAVDDISFEIESGKTFGLLGPNGAGKSTTINMIVGLLEPDAGSIEIDGVNSRVEARRCIGVAPQSIALYAEFTGLENLRFFASLYGYKGKSLARRVDWALEFSELADRSNDRVEEYSGGMQRRLNLAAALIHEPRILLLDEPTAGVDPQSRNHMFESIERLRNQGLTIIYTTHYMEEAQRLCDRVAIMDKGCVLDIDTVDGLIRCHGGASVIQMDLEHPPEPGTDLPGHLDGARLRIETDDPVAQINSLHERGIAFKTLDLHQPDLETVFLTLTGRHLRDE